LEIYQLDVFTATPGEGNPAGVVPDTDELAEEFFGEIARQTMLETAFVMKPTTKEAGLRLRYFSPNGQEMNLCAHASVGALYLLASQGRLKGDCTVETSAGLLQARIEREGTNIRQVVFQVPDPTFQDGPFPAEEVAIALGLSAVQVTATSLPMVAAATGRAKLLVPLTDYQTLDSVEIDRPALDALCQRLDLTGLYPFTPKPRNPGVTAEARQFPYNVGFEEDPVTGVAMGALASYLLHYRILPPQGVETRFVLEQGQAMGCPGRAEVFIRQEGDKITQVLVGGVAVVIDKSFFEG
jgi:PhzF family phenazine biosynthesis protein